MNECMTAFTSTEISQDAVLLDWVHSLGLAISSCTGETRCNTEDSVRPPIPRVEFTGSSVNCLAGNM